MGMEGSAEAMADRVGLWEELANYGLGGEGGGGSGPEPVENGKAPGFQIHFLYIALFFLSYLKHIKTCARSVQQP
mgnify:CR=1 FL=1